MKVPKRTTYVFLSLTFSSKQATTRNSAEVSRGQDWPRKPPLSKPSPYHRANRDAVSRSNVAVPGAKFEPVQIVATSVLWMYSEHPNSAEVVRSLVSEERTISITGELKYQACDTAICYPPNQCL